MAKKVKSPIIGIETCIDVRNRINPGRTYQFLEISYADAIAEAGGIPILLPYVRQGSLYGDILTRIDGLLITGGEDLPSNVPGETPEIPLVLTPDLRIEQDRALIEGVLIRHMPFLGICYGMQVINIHLSGTLYYDIPSQLPEALNHRPGDPTYRHVLRIENDTKLRTIVGQPEILVNSSHHQAVRDVGAGLKACGICEDGVIEAIEAEGDDYIVGIQWHPEKVMDENRRKIYSSFVDACRAFRHR
jgi:putative glutamine amidotransferase